MDATELHSVVGRLGLMAMVQLYKSKVEMITMKKNVEGITVKTVRPEEGIYEQCLDINVRHN